MITLSLLKKLQLAAVPILFSVLVAIFFWLSVQANDHHFVYARDDAYIHLAIAKHKVLNDVWGITPFEWSSSTSSPFWTGMLVVIFHLIGVETFIPFFVNTLASLLLLIAIDYIVKDIYRTNYRLGLFVRPIASLSVIVFSALTLLLFSGMEHILQSLVDVLFFYAAIVTLTSDDSRAWAGKVALVALAPFLCAVRYEGIFILGAVAVLLLARKRWRLSVLIMALSLAPIVVYGLLSLKNGWYFFPNPIILKGAFPDDSPFGLLRTLAGIKLVERSFSGELRDILLSVQAISIFLISFILTILDFQHTYFRWTQVKVALLILVQVSWAHLIFASPGLRYEAYLSVLTVVTIALLWDEASMRHQTQTRFPTMKRWGLYIFMLACVLVYGARGAYGIARTVQATSNIYEQQYQMSQFVAQFYDGGNVAANDIGAINYFADIHLLDLWGLGSLNVAREYLDAQYTPTSIQQMALDQEIELAIVYDEWFIDSGDRGTTLPSTWTAVGYWTVQNNVILGNDTVTFYAIEPHMAERIIDNLIIYQPKLPKTVEQRLASP